MGVILKVLPGQRAARILLIEDNKGDTILLQRAFSRSGTFVEFIVKDRAEAALEMLQSHQGRYGSLRPDLIIVDLNLPAMDGLKFLEMVKSDQETLGIPIIVMSSSTSDSDISESYRRHANGYIAKPLSTHSYDAVANQIVEYWLKLTEFPSARV